MTTKGGTMAKVRKWLYLIAALMGDAQAIRNGTVGKRLARRAAGEVTGRGLGRVFR